MFKSQDLEAFVTPVVLRILTALFFGGGALVAVHEFQDPIFPKIMAVVAVGGFVAACL